MFVRTFLLSVCTLFLFSANAQRIYVDAASVATAPNGTSWTTAFSDLQDAIDVAQAGDSIWIAIGTYFPTRDTSGNTSPSDPRERAFYLSKDSIALLGGFRGTETSLSQRNAPRNSTILSGDIGISHDDSDNAYHIMLVDGTYSTGNITSATLLESLTFTKGNADSTRNYGMGGGLFITGERNDNIASPTLVNCSFTHNKALAGGAICNFSQGFGNASPTFINCSFTQNHADNGGAVLNEPKLYGTSNPLFINCTFWQNEANFGGVVYNAGGVYGTASPVFTNCTFSKNKAPFGAAIYNNAGLTGFSVSTFTNCILWENIKFNDSTSFAAQLDGSMGTQNQISYSLVSGINTVSRPPAGWTNNLATDPRFVGANVGDFRLRQGSPAIDTGRNDSIPPGITTDFAGLARIKNAVVDIGAFEGEFEFTRIYVDSASTAINPDGTSWAKAFQDLQDGLDTAKVGDTIWVAKGTYFPSIEFDADTSGGSDLRERTFYLDKDSIKLFGGFQGNENLLSQRDVAVNPTMLSGDIGVKGDSTDNSYHVLYIDGTTSRGTISGATLIDGFTITAGNADRFFLNSIGGGMYLNGRETGNEVSPSIANCHFTQNTANSGGAVYSNGLNGGKSSPSYLNVRFTNNHANTSAGAVFNMGNNRGVSSPTFTNCLFFQNRASFGGVALVNAGEINGKSSPKLFNCTISQNSCISGAAVDNAATNGGTSTPIITNCIIWRNSVGNDSTSFRSQIRENLGSQSQIAFSLVNGIDTLSNKPATWTNNLALAPLFVNADAGDLRLKTGSPAIDVGSNDSIPIGITSDLAGNARIQNTSVDMGAFEGEVDELTRIYINIASEATRPDGASWATAFQRFQNGIDIATTGDTIWVAQGTYLPTKDRLGNANPPDDRNKTFYLNVDDVEIYGGFSGTETQLSQRDVDANPTILSGDLGIFGVPSDNAYHVMYIDGTSPNGSITPFTTLNGFTITAGVADGAIFPINSGAGIYINGRLTGNEASPVIINCDFVNNNALRSGGAIYNDGFNRGKSSPIITDCEFRTNSTAQDGGAIYNNGFNGGLSTPSISNCTFHQNSAGQDGGAIYNLGIDGTCSPVLTRSVFQQNTATRTGGVVYNNGERGISSPVVINCLFNQNRAFQSGVMFNNGTTNGESSPRLTNCTVSRNSSTLFGAIAGDASNGGTSSLIISNSILWENKTNSDSTSLNAQVSDSTGTQSTLAFSLANGLTSGIGNLSVDPLFVNADSGNFRLLNGSPAVNAGANDSLPSGTAVDLLGTTRIQRGVVDLGAYESTFTTAVDQITSPVTNLRAFPNPVSDKLILEWSIKPSTVTKDNFINARLYDLQSRMVRSYSLPTSQHTHVIELGDLPTNMYTLKVAGWSVKLIKQ